MHHQSKLFCCGALPQDGWCCNIIFFGTFINALETDVKTNMVTFNF